MPTQARQRVHPVTKTFLKEWRLHRGLSQAAIAKLTGTTSTTISRYETGLRIPTIAFLSITAEALRVGVRDLLERPPSDGSHDRVAKPDLSGAIIIEIFGASPHKEIEIEPPRFPMPVKSGDA